MKNAILAVTTSAAFSGILVLVTDLEHLLELNMEVWKSTMLLTAVVFIVVSTIFFVLEVQNFSEDHPHLHSRRERLIVVQFR